MNICTVEQVSKSFGDKKILDDVSLGVQEGDKIGLIGLNGSGKTTILRLLAGVESCDEGQIIKQNNKTLAYLSQDPEMPKNLSVLDYVLGDEKEEDWAVASEAKSILNRLGITNHDEMIQTLSGGQRKRVALAKTLLHPTDILILDEPTNHIDNEMAVWLEEYLQGFKGTLIMVTHDRYFLERVSNRIIEIDQAKLYSYPGNYEEFLLRKSEREEIARATERKRQSTLRVENAWAARGARARSTKQKARLMRLEELKESSGPKEKSELSLDSIGQRMGKKTIACNHIVKSYGEKHLIKEFDYIFLKNSRIGIIGKNGCGKSTLVKIIAGIEAPDSGKMEIGETIKIGYFSQNQEELKGSIRVIESIREIGEFIETKDGTISASQMLTRFLFDDDQQYAPVDKLSGGEKKRLALLMVLMEAPNVLILDEITNDLDIPTLIILEEFLETFSGIVITVSHDRYFLDNVVERILAFEEGGEIVEYMGDYSDYVESQKKTAIHQPAPKVEIQRIKNGKQKAPQKLKFTFAEQREYDRIDEDVAELEKNILEVSNQIEEFAYDYTELAKISSRKSELEEQLEEKMERWVYLNDLAERIENQ